MTRLQYEMIILSNYLNLNWMESSQGLSSRSEMIFAKSSAEELIWCDENKMRRWETFYRKVKLTTLLIVMDYIC